MAYTVHEIIHKHSLPLRRGKLTVYDFLAQYLGKYLDELSNSISSSYPTDFPSVFYQNLIANIVPKIATQYNLILEIIQHDQKHQHIKKRERFNDLMQALEHERAFRTISALKEGIMVRIRQGQGPFDRKQLFHISYNKRQFASSQRFSIPGDPCLYLSLYPGMRLLADDMLELAWIENGMPKKFDVCLFEAQEEIVFLHFGKKGSTYIRDYDDAVPCTYNKSERQEAIEQYLLTFPLRAACFISIEDKPYKSKVRFYEEYVFPQLLMEWIQQSSQYTGLTYQSASAMPEAKDLKSYNVAIPTKDIDPVDGFDCNLKRIFKLSIPESIDMSERVMRVEDKIDNVFTYVKNLEERISGSSASERHPYYHLLHLCYSFFAVCSALHYEDDPNIAMPYRQLVGLCHTALLINKMVKNVQTADEWVDLYKGYKGDTALSPNDYDEVLLGFQVVNSAFQSLREVLQPLLLNKYLFSKPDYDFI